MTRLAAALGSTLMVIAAAARPGEAHKPITSPYTFTEDVRPILQARCVACHSPGGVAPMSLLTHDETVPWGESIRLELIAGHMPPWNVENASDFRNADGLSARELNVLLTWAVGGTPRGDAGSVPTATAAPREWPLGPPDLVLQPDDAFTLAAERQSETAQFTLRAGNSQPRWVRAVDLRPGTPSIVRRATLEIDPVGPPADGAVPIQRTLALWQPGASVSELPHGAGVQLPPQASIILRIDYKRNWQHERTALSDRTSVGLYFAEEPAADVRALTLSPEPGERSVTNGQLQFVRTLGSDVRVLALYPDPALAGVRTSVVAVTQDGARRTLIDLRAAAGWARRYVYREPVALAAATRLEVTARHDSPALLPPGFPVQPPSRLEDVRVTLDVIAPAR